MNSNISEIKKNVGFAYIYILLLSDVGWENLLQIY